MVNILQYIIKKSADGLNKENYWSVLNQNANQISSKKLLITQQYSNISGLESYAFPSEIKRVSEDTIVQNIRSKTNDYAYALLSHIPGFTGQYYRTVVMDCKTAEPLYVYSWPARQ